MSKRNIVISGLDATRVVALLRKTRKRKIVLFILFKGLWWHTGFVRCLRHVQRDVTKEGSRTKKVREK